VIAFSVLTLAATPLAALQSVGEAPVAVKNDDPKTWVVEYPRLIRPYVQDYRRCLNLSNRRVTGVADFEEQHRADVPRCAEERAEAVAAEIRDGPYGIDPVIYEFRPDEGGDAASPEPQAASPETPPADPPEPSAAAPPEPAGAAEDGTVLQVGAYADQDSAAPQVERLTTLGFDVDTLREDGFVKLVIGPLSGAELDDARTILDGAGVEYFAR
jgi:hypothetical protein